LFFAHAFVEPATLLLELDRPLEPVHRVLKDIADHILELLVSCQEVDFGKDQEVAVVYTHGSKFAFAIILPSLVQVDEIYFPEVVALVYNHIYCVLHFLQCISSLA